MMGARSVIRVQPPGQQLATRHLVIRPLVNSLVMPKVHDSIGVCDEESCDDKDSKVVYEGSGDDDDEDDYESGRRM